MSFCLNYIKKPKLLSYSNNKMSKYKNLTQSILSSIHDIS
jgi:hypothetical protein